MGETAVISPSLASEIRRPSAVESLARYGALLAATAYAVGFVTVTFHHAQYGVGELSLLRPRVFSAGILFLLLTALPMVLSARLHGYFGLSAQRGNVIRTRPEDKTLGEVIVTVAMYAPCIALAYATKTVFEEAYTQAKWWHTLAFLSGALSLTVIHHFVREHPRKSLAAIFAAMLLAGWGIYGIEGTPFLLRTAWFYVCGLCARGLQNMKNDPEKWRTVEWEQYVGTIIVLTLCFSQFIYGNAKFRYGGGAPIPVRLFLGSESNGIPFRDQRFLLEETDSGYYLLEAADAKSSVFIPRAEVKAIQFNPPRVEWTSEPED